MELRRFDLSPIGRYFNEYGRVEGTDAPIYFQYGQPCTEEQAVTASSESEPLLVSAMRRRADDRRVHVRVGIPGAHESIGTTAAGFLAELDEYVEAVRAEARTVTAEQVEAAARALWGWGAGRSWDSQGPEFDRYRDHLRRRARAALEAAGFTVVGEED